MMRMFKLTAPTSGTSSLWDLIVATGEIDSIGNVLSGGLPTGEYIFDRGCNLDISTDTGNGSVTVAIQDRLGKSFNAFLPNTNFNKQSPTNSICLKDYFPKASSGTPVIEVSMEYR